MIEQIYSHQEVISRFELHQFIHNIGTPTIPSNSNTPQGITAGELLDAFKIKHRCDLTSEIVEMFLITGGFVPAEERQTKLYLKIDVKAFSDLTPGEQAAIIKWIEGPISVTLRKMMLGYTKVTNKETKEELLETPLSIFIKRFIKYYCIDDRTHYGNILSTETRASTKQLYSYYITVCASLNYANPLGLKKFIEFIRALGYHVQKGYVRGVSGINHVVHLHIPAKEEDLRDSILYGMCVITTKDYRITTDMMFKEYSTIALEEFSKSRVRRMLDVDNYEQTTETKTIETEEQGSGARVELLTDRNENVENQEIGRRDENSVHAGKSEISEETEVDISNDGGVQPITESIQIDDSEDESERTSVEDEVTRTSNTETPIARPSHTSYQRRGPVQILRKPVKSVNTGAEEQLMDPMAGMAELLNGTPDDEPEEDVDISAIADALKIPLLTMYGNDPRKMSKEDMNKYLKLMHINVTVDDVYEQIIQKLS
jgi:hypothetical protein